MLLGGRAIWMSLWFRIVIPEAVAAPCWKEVWSPLVRQEIQTPKRVTLNEFLWFLHQPLFRPNKESQITQSEEIEVGLSGYFFERKAK